jgi:hypothetical protein
VTSNDTRIRDRRDAKFPRKKWGEAVKRQADLVFEVLPTHDDTPSTLMHIDEIARRTGLNRPLVARAISYMRNEFGEGSEQVTRRRVVMARLLRTQILAHTVLPTLLRSRTGGCTVR